MKRTTWVLGLLFVGAAALVASTPAEATCGTSLGFGQDTPGACGGSYCYVVSPGVNTASSIKARYWSVGNGDPAIGPGIDNGSIGDAGNWLVSFGGPLSLFGDWATVGVDG